MQVIACIEDEQAIRKILKHLDLWDIKRKTPPRANAPPPEALIIHDCQFPRVGLALNPVHNSKLSLDPVSKSE
jgi:hypothetical protein